MLQSGLQSAYKSHIPQLVDMGCANGE